MITQSRHGLGTGAFERPTINLTDAEVAHRRTFLGFTEAAIRRLEAIDTIARQYANEVIDASNQHLLSFEDTRALFDDPKTLEYVKQRQRDYFLRLTKGNNDSQYVQERLTIVAIHERIGLSIKSYLSMYNVYLRGVATRHFTAFSDNPDEALATFLSPMKLTFLDIGLAIDTYIVQRERTIHQQQEAIRELSTLVLQVHERLLILPIVGAIDTQRSRQLTEQLLRAIRNTRAKVIVIDITGVPAVDTTVANHLVQTVDVASLMGASTIVTGMSPEIARTAVTLGVDLGKMRTLGDLQEGIEEPEQLLGYTVHRRPTSIVSTPTESG
jgi:rsbT co-antagonist protein RsbR